MKSKEEVDLIMEIPEWAEKILGLENLDLFVFSEIYDTFKFTLKSFDLFDWQNMCYHPLTNPSLAKFQCSAKDYFASLKNLVDKNLVTMWTWKGYPTEKKKYKPNIPFIQEQLLKAGMNEIEFLSEEIELGEYRYTIPLELLYSIDEVEIPNFSSLGPVTIHMELVDKLGITGTDLLIMSAVYDRYFLDNCYSITYELQILTGLTEDELVEYFDELCYKKILFSTKDLNGKPEYHINEELFDTMKFMQYCNKTKTKT